MKYFNSRELTEKVRKMAKLLNIKDIDRIYVIKSAGSKSNAIARIHGLSKAFQAALNCKAIYVIEIISEKFDRLSKEEKIKTIIHELLHIPKNFGGGFRHHDYVNRKRVNKIYNKFKDKFYFILFQ